MNETAVLKGLALSADEDELRQLIHITDTLDSRDLVSWLYRWARGEITRVVRNPDAPYDRGPATPARVIGYFNAYLGGER